MQIPYEVANHLICLYLDNRSPWGGLPKGPNHRKSNDPFPTIPASGHQIDHPKGDRLLELLSPGLGPQSLGEQL